MTDKDFEQFCGVVLTLLRTTLTKASEATWTPRQLRRRDETTLALPAKVPPSGGRWVPLAPRTPELQAARQSLPPVHASWAGFRLVDIAQLGAFALIAFQWRETGDKTFIYLADMHGFAESAYPAAMTETIISMNLLEQVGGQWYLHVPLIRIGGLTFMENVCTP